MRPKRIKPQREQDLLFIERLYVQGRSQREIAAMLSRERPYTLSHKTIGRDIHEILARWRAEMLRGIDELKAAELARLNRMEREAWDAWERSCQIKERTLSEQKQGTAAGQRAQLTREQQTGDPRYLQIVQWCITKRCAILGLDAPTQVQQTVMTTFSDFVRTVSTEKAHATNTTPN